MKIKFSQLKGVFLLLIVQWMWVPAFSQDVLQNYVEESIKNNLGLQNQGISLQRSIYALKEARGLFLPDVQLSTQYLASGGGRKIEIPIGDLLNPVYSSLNNLTNSSNFPKIENVSQTFNPNNFYDAKVHTTLAIYNAEIIYNSRIRKEQITLQQAQLNVYKRELIKNVKLAYFSYQQSLQANKILENAIQLAQENLKINQLMVKNGKAIRTVVSRAENELTGLKAKLQDSKLKSLNAAAYFNFLLNKPLNSSIVIEEDNFKVVASDTTQVHKREELSALESAERVNSLSVRLNRSSAVPKLSTFLDMGAQGDFIKINHDSPYYLFGVTMSWQIFAGNRNKNKTKQASLDLRSSQNQTIQAEQQLQLEANTAQNNYVSSLELYRSAVSQTALSKQYFKDEQRLYKEGQALYLELLDAQVRLIDDQLKESLAFLTVQTRQTELERAKASYIL
jgi:outer membrane protein TolC